MVDNRTIQHTFLLAYNEEHRHWSLMSRWTMQMVAEICAETGRRVADHFRLITDGIELVFNLKPDARSAGN